MNIINQCNEYDVVEIILTRELLDTSLEIMNSIDEIEQIDTKPTKIYEIVIKDDTKGYIKFKWLKQLFEVL